MIIGSLLMYWYKYRFKAYVKIHRKYSKKKKKIRNAVNNNINNQFKEVLNNLVIEMGDRSNNIKFPFQKTQKKN